ncbi:hypothetical protein MMC13_005197 [Lambiella insularis]|nr:hypothetical protein [Lambiella insularis]
MSSTQTFDDPTSLAGQRWKSIIASLGETQGWFAVYWGRRVEQSNEVEVIIEWSLYAAARTFLSDHYNTFEQSLVPLLQCSPQKPILVQLNGSGLSNCAPAPDIVCSIYKIHYKCARPVEHRHGMEVQFSFYAQSIIREDAEGWSTGWALPLSTTNQVDDSYWSEGRIKTFFILIGWPSIGAEETFNKTQKVYVPTLDKEMTSFESYVQGILNWADGGWENFHVPLEMVSTTNLQRWKKSKKLTWPY